MDTPEHCGRRPDARKRRTGKTQIFWLGAVGGNTDFDLTDLISNLAAVAALCAKADAALVQGATGGQHSRRLAKRCPQIGSQQQGYTHLLQGLLAARAPRRLSRKKTS